MLVEREEQAGVQEAVFPIGKCIDCYNAQIHFENDHPPGQSHFLQGEGKTRWKAETIEAHRPGRHAGHDEHGAGGSESFAADGRCGTPYSLYPFAVSFRKKIERIAATHERNDYAEEDFGHACVKHLWRGMKHARKEGCGYDGPINNSGCVVGNCSGAGGCFQVGFVVWSME